MVDNSSISSVTAISELPGLEVRQNSETFARPNAEVDKNARFSRIIIDSGFVKTYGLQLLSGKMLPDTKIRYGQLALINEEALKNLRFNNPEEAVGQVIQWRGRSIEIYGVVKNFNFEGLQKSIYPIVMEFNHPTEFGYYSLKVNTGTINSVMGYIKETWGRYYPKDPFNCFFQDEFYNQQYQSFKRTAKFNIIFALISVFISCLGLYGIVMFYIARKKKERNNFV